MILPAISFTPEGGLALRLINRTGAASVRGEIVKASTSIKGFGLAAANEDFPIGVVYDSGVANLAPCRVGVGGSVQVLMKNTVGTTVGDILYVSDTAGRAQSSSTLPAAASIYRTIGHALETVSGGTNVLVWAVLHFN